jgi:hypothetical protein
MTGEQRFFDFLLLLFAFREFEGVDSLTDGVTGELD